MVYGSHNAWSYLKPRTLLMRLFAFTAKCQAIPISRQYTDYDVRCFDLRIRFDEDGNPIIAHGCIEYDYDMHHLAEDLETLDKFGDCSVRILHEVRREKDYTEEHVKMFQDLCAKFEKSFPHIKFWCGKNLYNWEVDYDFPYKPTYEEKYSSVCPPKLIDDWFPWLYARFHNKEIKEEGSDKDILLIDFVNIPHNYLIK